VSEPVSADEYECPRCRTVYFEPKDSCDWCPDVKPVLVQPVFEGEYDDSPKVSER
jgi:hypothetical protein